MSARHPTKASNEELLQAYEHAAAEHGRALLAANRQATNRAYDRVAAAYRELRSRAATHQLLPLLKSADPNVRAWAAAHALEFAPEQGEPVLRELTTQTGPLRTSAE